MSDNVYENYKITSREFSNEKTLDQIYYDEYEIDIEYKKTNSKLNKFKNWLNDMGRL